MIKLRTLLMENVAITIDNILKDLATLPDSDVNDDLFGQKNNKLILTQFFNDIKNGLKNPNISQKLTALLNASDLYGSPTDIHQRLNDPKSPVRNLLITQNIQENSMSTPPKRWSAVVIDDKSRNLLLSTYKTQIPQGWEIIAHHQTINPFGTIEGEGTPVTLKVLAIGLDEKVLAVKVSGYAGKTNNAFPHITIAVNRAEGGKPKDSNEIKNWTPVLNGVTLTGTVQNL